MELHFSTELERIFAHTWCHNVRRDYRLNRLWNGERAVHVSLGMGLRQWLDPYEDIRVWFEDPEEYQRQGKMTKKIIDLIIVKLSPKYKKQVIYDEMTDITYDILLICEIKYSGSKRTSIDSDLEFLEWSLKKEDDIINIFAWIPYTEESQSAQEKISRIINLTTESSLRFMLGRPDKPFRWSYYANGEEKYFHQED